MRVTIQTPMPVADPQGTTIDIISEEDVQVEILRETGFPNMYKLYVHGPDGNTLVRACKLRAKDIDIGISLVAEQAVVQGTTIHRTIEAERSREHIRPGHGDMGG